MWRKKMRKSILLTVSIILLSSLIACSRESAELPDVSLGMIKLNGILYISILDPSSITEQDISFYDTIKRNNENVYRDGDASLLEAGTTVYSIADYAPDFRLAVKKEQELVIYQASRNPNARKGSDLLDIGGKVGRISIKQVNGGTELGSITESRQIEELVGLVLEASIFDTENQITLGAPDFMLSFYLTDGTKVGGFFWLSTRELSPPGLELPKEFGDAILNATGVK